MPKSQRPYQFLDYLPQIYGAENLQMQPTAVHGTTIDIEPINTGPFGVRAGLPLFCRELNLKTIIAQDIPAHKGGWTTVTVEDEAFAEAIRQALHDDESPTLAVFNFLTLFLQPFQQLFEALEDEIEGTPGGDLELTVEAVEGNTIVVQAFNRRTVSFPANTAVTVVGRPELRTTLAEPIPPAIDRDTTQNFIMVKNPKFAQAIYFDEKLIVHAGGIPDLFDPNTAPPPQFRHLAGPDFDYLQYLAGWIGLTLREDVLGGEWADMDEGDVGVVDWNRELFKETIPLMHKRSTLPGMNAMLRAWLHGELMEGTPPPLVLTDLMPAANGVDTAFQLAPRTIRTEAQVQRYAQMGVNTILGIGPPFYFVTDLVTNPGNKALRNPVGLNTFQREARFLLDGEKPAQTYYQLRIRAHTMQLAPPQDEPIESPGEVYAQTGVTTMLWEQPWIINTEIADMNQ